MSPEQKRIAELERIVTQDTLTIAGLKEQLDEAIGRVIAAEVFAESVQPVELAARNAFLMGEAKGFRTQAKYWMQRALVAEARLAPFDQDKR